MKLGKTLIIVGLIAAGILSLNFQAQAGNPPGDSPVIEGNEYWGVIILACSNFEVTLRVKRVVDCVVETDSLIERYPLAICPTTGDITANQVVGQWFAGCCPNRILLTDTGSPCAPNFWFFFFKIFTNAQIAIDYTDYLC